MAGIETVAVPDGHIFPTKGLSGVAAKRALVIATVATSRQQPNIASDIVNQGLCGSMMSLQHLLYGIHFMYYEMILKKSEGGRKVKQVFIGNR